MDSATGVGMGIDEARRDDEVFGGNDFFVFVRCEFGGDLDDSRILDSEVAFELGFAGSIDDCSALDEDCVGYCEGK